jgi:glucan phosphoethanolaminetransferase (alkaline phosphatase superfamily)
VRIPDVDKKWPVALTLLHSLLSGIGSYKSWPLKVFSGLETESALIAIIAAAIGTLLGLFKPVKRKQLPLLILFGLVFVLATLKYSSILSQVGSTPGQIYFAMLLLFVIILIFFYILTYLERQVAKTFPAKKSANDG